MVRIQHHGNVNCYMLFWHVSADLTHAFDNCHGKSCETPQTASAVKHLGMQPYKHAGVIAFDAQNTLPFADGT